MPSSELRNSPPVKLVSSQKRSREKSLRILLKSWQSQNLLPQNDAKKLWKSLFNCVLHSDKPHLQSDLIDRITSHLSTLHHHQPSLALQYFSIFFITIRRELSGIDSLRLEKFYLLIRRFISNLFSLLNKNSWNLEFVESFMNCLGDATFCGKDKLLIKANGVNYHVVSVFLDEITPFLPVNLCVLEVLFRPFFDAMVKLNDKVLLGKIKSCFFDVLLMNGKRLLEVKKNGDEDCNGDVVNLGTIAIVMEFSSKLFELGSGSDCVEGSRKVLFELHRAFLKLERDAVNSGFKVISDSVDQGAKDLVPIVEVVGLGKKGSVDKGKMTKKKKNKKSGNCEMNCADKNVANENGGNSNDEQVVDGEGAMVLNESMLSNLQKRFENIAAEGGFADSVASEATGIVSNKRKRTKNSEGKTSQDCDLNGGDVEYSAVAKSGEKSSKRVKFSMESNLVWMPHSPLPPESLRIPPSVTPRGSALKKGVPPGPICDTPLPLPTKGAKRKKARDTIRLMKLKSLSV
ncbi:uncharacterized protein LOC123921040 [Trifolium pratense]|uniref:Uncharacterized protein n=1 Tax=Trifolium pratense TaxID=57577 RepID=A0ACB0IP34_TRIPR|nr:uncharacterized protein LOC123921040 [Trifolium pratense]XP_045829387.1 uncharacterized protein LOC123921040 [Trifolium pratense]XP_045829388.1 uncharacterized protein LOC123921040 [Trifolium pratense]XP_045829389.1 uncharacterized protein LOC123921040 [Trifolium pratense]XP_045829390.1 uncharacterized protein LOC123921040 [Trifolium pratense]XP_045829391.1 uncharacterized protein LOC123921040 [Trifolium pratense]XP_045829392.1 uncharacterized protein LOC123921040 [Trifolium pratense]XP_0